MRTTITIDGRLFGQLKKRASETGTSVSRVIAQAIRLFMRMPRAGKSADRFELVTFGAGGHFSRENIDQTSSLLAADDLNRFRGE